VAMQLSAIRSEVPDRRCHGPGFRVRAAMHTNPGGRPHNEDSAYVDPEHRFFIVADGIGGHEAGEVASALAVEVVRDRLSAAQPELARLEAMPRDQHRHAVSAILECAVRGAHYEVGRQGGRTRLRRKMGTTLDVVLLSGGAAFIAHVGDSRVYRVRDRSIEQLTQDHTMAVAMVAGGAMSREQALTSSMRTVLSNAIGVSPQVRVELVHVPLEARDVLLLCTDGLYDYFEPYELARRLSGREPELSVRELVYGAVTRGGHDNITGVVVEAIGGDERGARG